MEVFTPHRANNWPNDAAKPVPVNHARAANIRAYWLRRKAAILAATPITQGV